METVKIQSKDNSTFGKIVTLPIDGETSVDESGILEVSAAAAKLLVENTSDYEYIDGSSKPKAAKKTSEKAEKAAPTKPTPPAEEEEDEEEETEEDEDNEEEEDEDESEDTEETEEEDAPGLTKESLQALEVTELVAILKEAGVDETKYAKLLDKKGLLINYILKNV